MPRKLNLDEAIPLSTKPFHYYICTSEPAIAEISREEHDDRNNDGVHGHMTVQSFEFHQSLCAETVVEQVIDQVVVLPMVETDV